MMKRVSALLSVALFLLVFGAAVEASAQKRKAVGAAEASGTFRSHFRGRFKSNYNQIKILALGKGKLQVAFELMYPHLDGEGEFTANTGMAEGVAEIKGDTAVFTTEEFGGCRITIKFVKPGVINVTQSIDEGACGFGFNVRADGTYKKTSRAKPKFGE
ncbi:MAG TPA: hypothetical protein VF599_23670 [Pyrinomonadaceae bacterium]|jgi:hypothetical protein